MEKFTGFQEFSAVGRIIFDFFCLSGAPQVAVVNRFTILQEDYGEHDGGCAGRDTE